MKGSKKVLISAIVLALLGIFCILSGTYALFYYNRTSNVENEVTTGKVTFRFDEDSVQGISLKNAMPILDYEGTELEGEGQVFDFTISTDGTDTLLYYSINIVATEESTLDPELVKVYLTNVVDGVETSSCINDNNVVPTGIGQIGEGYFRVSPEAQERHYRLRLWVDKDADFSPLQNDDGTYKTDEEGNYIYPYNNQTFKAKINVEATAGNIGDGLCTTGPWDGSDSCDEGQCYIGTTFTLPDNSTWRILDRDYSQNTVTLIYDHYIDASGNYNVDENFTYNCGMSGCNSTVIDVDTALNNFASNLKQSLQDENITVSIPSAEMVGVTLKENYNDAYILHTSGLNWNYKNPYILSDYNTTTVCPEGVCIDAKEYYILGNNKVSNITYHIANGSTTLNVGIKPIITISEDYLPE